MQLALFANQAAVLHMKNLTRKQRETLLFIQSYLKEQGVAPSYREIMSHFGLHSTSAVHKQVQALVKKGALSLEKGLHRSLQVVERHTDLEEGTTSPLSLIGLVTAGLPMETFASPQTIAIPPSFVRTPEATYLLRVQGSGFRSEMIEEGDLLFIETQTEAQPGDLVLGLLHGQQSVIRRYFPEGQHIRLDSLSQDLPSLIVRQDHFPIQGTITGLLRSYF